MIRTILNCCGMTIDSRSPETVVFSMVFALSLIILYGEFVDKIIVHEPNRSSDKRQQRVEIRYNFVGEIAG